jgi:hypothetical protein
MNNGMKRWASFAISVMALPVESHAETLVGWNFDTIPAATADLENSPQPQPLLEADLGNGAAGFTLSDLDHVGLVYSTAVSPGEVGTSIAGELNIKNFDLGGDGINDNYLFFTLTADAGNSISVNSISVELWRNGGGAPDGMAFEVSVDGGEFELFGDVQTIAESGGGAYQELTFEGGVSGATTVEIRFTPRHVNAGSTGNLHLDSLKVDGSVEGGLNGLQINSIQRLADGSVSLTWNSKPNPETSYTVFYTEDLALDRSLWNEGRNDNVPSGGAETTYVVTAEELDDPAAKRLFFVVVENF